MFAGGILLTITAALLGEFRGFRVRRLCRGKAWFALRLSDRRRFNHGIHGICLADPSRVADEGWDVCVRESGGRGVGGIFPRWRTIWRAHCSPGRYWCW